MNKFFVFFLLSLSLLNRSQAAMEIPTEDNRTPIVLSKEEKVVALFEMRTFVEALNGIFRSMANNDFTEAAKFARSSGMAVPQNILGVHPEIIGKLPLGVKFMGMQTHRQFDQLAKILEKKETPEKIYQKLGEVTNNCVACHRAYRFEEI